MTEREKEKLSNTRNGTTNPDEEQWDGDRKDRRRDGAATSMDKKRRRLTD